MHDFTSHIDLALLRHFVVAQTMQHDGSNAKIIGSIARKYMNCSKC